MGPARYLIGETVIIFYTINNLITYNINLNINNMHYMHKRYTKYVDNIPASRGRVAQNAAEGKRVPPPGRSAISLLRRLAGAGPARSARRAPRAQTGGRAFPWLISLNYAKLNEYFLSRP